MGLQLGAATAVTAASAPSSTLPLFLLNRQDRMNLLHKGFFISAEVDDISLLKTRALHFIHIRQLIFFEREVLLSQL